MMMMMVNIGYIGYIYIYRERERQCWVRKINKKR